MSRDARMKRLAMLRAQQHDAATMVLRAARGSLHATESLLEESCRNESAANSRLADFSKSSDANEWLLACADVEWSKLAISRVTIVHQRASQAVDQAAGKEREARRAAKQMEMTCKHMHHKEAERILREDQRVLDEASRVISRNLSNPMAVRRFI